MRSMCGTAVTLYSGLLFHSTFDLADYTPKYMMDTVFFPPSVLCVYTCVWRRHNTCLSGLSPCGSMTAVLAVSGPGERPLSVDEGVGGVAGIGAVSRSGSGRTLGAVMSAQRSELGGQCGGQEDH